MRVEFLCGIVYSAEANVLTFDDLIAKSYSTRRLALLVVSIFSGAALLLSAGSYDPLAVALSILVLCSAALSACLLPA